MNLSELAKEIINGRRLTREDDLSFFITCDLKELCDGADKIREALVGEKVDLCSIINGRSGRCPEDCKYCAQSAHNHTDCEVYDFLDEDKIVEACKLNESECVDRFSIVTAGRALTGEEFEKAVHAYERISEDDILRTIAFFRYINPETNIRLAAGRGLITNDAEIAFKSGASATITGNMLTTVACATIRSDRKMLEEMGRDVTPDYMRN